MKKYIIYSLYVLAVVMLSTASCSSDNDNSVVDLIVNSNIPTTPLSSEGIIELYTDNYTAESLADWCSISTEGNLIKVKIDYNESYINRFTAIVVTHKGVRTSIPITQLGLLFEFPAEAPNLLYSLRGGDREFRLVCNVPFEVVPSHSWISYEISGKDGKELKITAPANDVAREGTLILKYAGKEMVLPVRQELILTYAELLGNVTMEYKDKDKNPVTQNAVLTVNVDEKSVWLTTTFPKIGETKFQINYDVIEGSMHIPGGQVLHEFTDPDPKFKAVKYVLLDFFALEPPMYANLYGVSITYDGLDTFEENYARYTFKVKEKAWTIVPLVPIRPTTVHNLDGIIFNGRRKATALVSDRVTGADYDVMSDLIISRKTS